MHASIEKTLKKQKNSKSKFTIKETLNKKERKYRVDSGDEAGVKRVSMMEKMVDSLVD